MDFKYITLTADQMDALNACRNDMIAVTNENQSVFHTLERIDMVSVNPLYNQKLYIPDASGIVKKGATVTSTGISYLRWYEDKLRLEKEEEDLRNAQIKRKQLKVRLRRGVLAFAGLFIGWMISYIVSLYF